MNLDMGSESKSVSGSGSPKPETKNKWACVVRFGGVGDNLIASSVLPGLRAKFGHVEVITRRPWGIVFDNNPYIDKLTYKEEDELPNTGPDDWQKWFLTRAKEYESFHHLSHTCEMTLALFSLQTQFWWPASMRRKICGKNYLEMVHDVCELPYAPIGARFYPTDEEIARAKQDKAEKIRKGRSGPVVGVVCSGTRIDKRHPRLGHAIARLITELEATVVLFGGPTKDRLIAKEIEDLVKHHNGSIRGEIPGLGVCISLSEEDETWHIRRSLSQVRECDLVITPDTGPAWAVSMCPMPKILLLSHASEENIAKYWVNTTVLKADPERVPCWPCHRLHNDSSTCVPNPENDGPACMSDISIETIMKAAREALGVDKPIQVQTQAQTQTSAPSRSKKVAKKGNGADEKTPAPAPVPVPAPTSIERITWKE
jgi:ADP-heptose:LPS heptosyltransferase